MEKERKCQLMLRWSLVTAGAIALFWTIWYLIADQVPTATRIKISSLTFGLTFGLVLLVLATHFQRRLWSSIGNWLLARNARVEEV